MVLDPFVGSGSTVVAVVQEGKQGVGLDVSPDYITQARHGCGNTQSFWDDMNVREPVLKVSNANDPLRHVEPNSVDLCVTSPPYWNILTEKRTADYKVLRHYGNREHDLGTIADYGDFLGALRSIFEKVFVAMKPSCYCIVVVMDLRKKDRFSLSQRHRGIYAGYRIHLR